MIHSYYLASHNQLDEKNGYLQRRNLLAKIDISYILVL
jgi:hypothetical protein